MVLIVFQKSCSSLEGGLPRFPLKARDVVQLRKHDLQPSAPLGPQQTVSCPCPEMGWGRVFWLNTAQCYCFAPEYFWGSLGIVNPASSSHSTFLLLPFFFSLVLISNCYLCTHFVSASASLNNCLIISMSFCFMKWSVNLDTSMWIMVFWSSS